MSLSDDLLEQAEHLAARDPTRPKQASLRRSISAAYYALFHLLVQAATGVVASDPKLRTLVPRAFDHGDMKKACNPFSSGQLPDHLKAVTAPIVPDDLKKVATAFIELQQARHEADYNVAERFSRADVVAYTRQVRAAFEAWARVCDQQIATVFLVNLLLGSKWKRGA